MNIHLIAAAVLALAGNVSALCTQHVDSLRFESAVSRLTESVNRQEYDSVEALYGAAFQKAFPTSKTKILFQRLLDGPGRIVRRGVVHVVSPRQANVILALERGVQELQIYLDPDGKISGYVLISRSEEAPARSFLDSLAPDPSVPPAARAGATVAAESAPPAATAGMTVPTPPVAAAEPPVDPPAAVNTKPMTEQPRPVVVEPSTPVIRDKQRTQLYPPFRGEWFVIEGGVDTGQAPHRNLLMQMYAYEFGADQNRSRYSGSGARREDYYAFGKEVVAPASGVVVEAVDGIADNEPGKRNPYALIGNAVVIRHSDREYSVLAYLKQGSVRVRAGDPVQKGQLIGLCGSSGGATEPAIHYHLQNTGQWSTATTLKFYFEQVGVAGDDSTSVQRDHSPVAGERLRAD
jgi:hypothetical protein